MDVIRTDWVASEPSAASINEFAWLQILSLSACRPVAVLCSKLSLARPSTAICVIICFCFCDSSTNGSPKLGPQRLEEFETVWCFVTTRQKYKNWAFTRSCYQWGWSGLTWDFLRSAKEDPRGILPENSCLSQTLHVCQICLHWGGVDITSSPRQVVFGVCSMAHLFDLTRVAGETGAPSHSRIVPPRCSGHGSTSRSLQGEA